MPGASTLSVRPQGEAGAPARSVPSGAAVTSPALADWRQTIVDLLRVSRPRFWLYLGGTYLVGYAFGVTSPRGMLSLVFAVHLLYFLVPANVFLYGINDLFDEDTDQHNPKKGQQEHRLRRDDKRAVRIAVALSAGLGVVLTVLQPTTAGRFFFAAFLVLGAAYSMPPARLKARPFLDFASNALYAMPGFLAYVQASGELPPVLALLGAAAWTGAMHLFSAVPDIAADRAAGLSTTATVLGARASLGLCAVLWLFAALSAIGLAIAGGGGLALLVALGAVVYPGVSIALLRAPEQTGRLYWLFPWLNATMGFLLFVVAVTR